jgi:hypothetical protein
MRGDIMELTIEKHEYEGIKIDEVGGDLELTLLLLNMKIELEVMPYDLLKDLMAQLSLFYTEDELREIMEELLHQW